ncbi:hypothetical protein CRE_27348 [Caenorhabditis remanei]|uniref:alpha-1,2-Mannosidase n=1 Tax=Caenorhabditis remanei TaxID=31234 RepID=E3LPW4_CAERE|nr:hypothetical protein CRE_27348 [Caenorhabditis remanei]
MKTVRFNKQALAVVAACFIFLLCIVSYFSTTSSEAHNTVVVGDRPRGGGRLAVRDVANRHIAEQKEPEIARVIHSKSVGEVERVVSQEKIEKLRPARVDPKPQVEKVEEKTSTEETGVGEAPIQSSEGLEKLIGKIHYEDKDEENGVYLIVLNLSERFEISDLRRQKVKEMMIHAWQGYKNYSWGANELKPVAKTPNSQNIFGGSQMPATIVDAADTLYIMDLKEQYKEARDYIEKNFSMAKSTSTLSVFETTIRFLGGLLSLYALTQEPFYIEKAREVGEALLPAFNTPSGIPKSNLDVASKHASNYGWANGGQSILSEVGSLHLEFLYLSRIAQAPIFEKKVKKVRDALEKAEKPNGLYSNYISPDTGRFTGSHMSLGALGDSFYEYLIKSYVQSNYTDRQAKNMYWDVSDAIQKHMIKVSKQSKLTYTVELNNMQPQHKMGHLACFVPGMFALQAINEDTEEEKSRIMTLAEELAKTCHESYIRTETHIGPEMFYFNDNDEATSKHSENGYIQRPEVIEGWFYLWRLTGKTMYRDWVWDAVQAVEKYCRVDSGFTGLQNVYNPKSVSFIQSFLYQISFFQGRDDVMQSFFLAEFLKYAYLTFADDSLISLEKWVFNTEAHPVPILSH